MKILFLATLVSTAVYVTGEELCLADDNSVFKVKVNLFAGELGYYEFEGCDGVNPTLGMEIGETYTFDQLDVSNYYHPMGFSYIADGAHDDQPELEPGVSVPEEATCVGSLSCPAPMYYKNGEYLGNYSNLPGQAAVGDDNFGLDDYEPEFFFPIGDWASSEYTIKLTFDDTVYDKDIFYFCHIHQFMTGRIKLLSNGVEINAEDTPALGYHYDTPSDFDQGCGTFGMDDYQLPNEFCPPHFVCGVDHASQEVQDFSDCVDAMNCQMMHGMTTGITSNSEIALFIHQMIPHHQNAVNMAKALLKTGKVDCDDINNEDDPSCVMQQVVREIINGQNYQIQTMRGVLADEGLPEEDNCEVPLAIDGNGEDSGVSRKLFGGAMANLALFV